MSTGAGAAAFPSAGCTLHWHLHRWHWHWHRRVHLHCHRHAFLPLHVLLHVGRYCSQSVLLSNTGRFSGEETTIHYSDHGQHAVSSQSACGRCTASARSAHSSHACIQAVFCVSIFFCISALRCAGHAEDANGLVVDGKGAPARYVSRRPVEPLPHPPPRL